MPEAFDKCKAAGGKVRRKTLKGGRWQNLCIDGSGKTHPGYIHDKSGKRESKGVFDKVDGD